MFLVLRRGVSAAPVALLVLVFLPWLPFRLPAALVLWSGPLVLLVWIAFAGALACGSSFRLSAFTSAGPKTAGLLAFAIGALAWWQVAPMVPGGDEPHYLVIAQSLLKDGDLQIENNHRNRDYASYFAGTIPPDFRVRGRNGQIYSIHAPGLSAVVAPVFAIAGYRGVVFFLLLISAAGSALAWHLAWLVTGRRDAAWFGWAAVTCSTTWIFHTFTVYPDGVGAVIVLTGAWALIRADREVRAQERVDPAVVLAWRRAGVAAVAAYALCRPRQRDRRDGPAAHVAAAERAGQGLRLSRCPRGELRRVDRLLHQDLWHARSVGSIRRRREWVAFVPDGLAGLFFDQRFGLIAYAPVLLFAFVGIGVMIARPAWRRQALELLFVHVPYLILVTHFAMWWGGRSAPARFYVPLLLWMVIPAAAAWVAMTRRSTRIAAAGALAVTVFASAVLVTVQDGVLAFNARQTYALWLDWLNGAVDLARALPVWWRETELPLFRGIAVWLGAAHGRMAPAPERRVTMVSSL